MPIQILSVFANPKGTNNLRLGEEERVIKECIKRSKHREKIHLVTCHATTIDDIARALLEEQFMIVHVSGHGTGRGLILEDESGKIRIPPPRALAEMFHAYCPPLQCVILNSCYSITQGILTALGIPYTIAMENSISDKSAIEFTRGFYDAIGAGRDIEFSFGEGMRRILLKHFDILQLPILLKKDEVIRWPKKKLPIQLDNGEAAYAEDIVSEGYCQCERDTCIAHNQKVYCYWPKWLSDWVINKHLYWRCYDEYIICHRCGKEHKRGHIGKINKCAKPYKNQDQQID